MARYVSMEHVKFLLQEVHSLDDLFTFEKFNHLNWEQAWMIIESAKQLADRDMAPYFRIMDEEPVRYDGKGGVSTRPQLRNIIRNGAGQGWIGGAA